MNRGLILALLLLLPGVLALDYLGDEIKQGEPANLIQGCASSTYANITSITYPDSSFALNTPTSMQKNGDDYNYTFTDTIQLGDYIVAGNCDEYGELVIWRYAFVVTPSGSSLSPSFYFLVIGFFYILAFAGIFIDIPVISIAGGLGMFILALFTITNGIADYRGTITLAVSYITLALGAIFAIGTAIEMMNE